MSEQKPLLSRGLVNSVQRPEKILQFGTGNFLKGFVDWIVHRLNRATALDAGIVAIKLRRGNETQLDRINAQGGLFTVNVRGLEGGQSLDTLELVESQNRALSPYQDYAACLALAEQPELAWVISNTTEAGIYYNDSDVYHDQPPESFPAKLTVLLHRRFQHFQGDPARGLRIFCCELIENNASVLRDIILRHAQQWQLEPEFSEWVNNHCRFCNTLVDRIVTGRPTAERQASIADRLDYRDEELIETESYYQWVIEAAAGDEEALAALFPAAAELNVVITPDLELYRQRKVRILNGAHSGCVALARLLDIDTVYNATCDADLRAFMQRLVYREICPTIGMPQEAVVRYADAILERFANPFLHHEWRSIALNSLSKWQARLWPVLEDIRKRGASPPVGLVTSLACLLLLYRGQFNGRSLQVQDDPQNLQLVSDAWEAAPDLKAVTTAILSEKRIWGADLSDPQLVEVLAERMTLILEVGLRQCLRGLEE